MAKLKTKKGVKKRFKLTKNKKVKYHPGGKSHLLSSKEVERVRRLRKGKVLGDKKKAKYLKKMLPYG